MAIDGSELELATSQVLSRQKFSSNVVERCLQLASGEAGNRAVYAAAVAFTPLVHHSRFVLASHGGMTAATHSRMTVVQDLFLACFCWEMVSVDHWFIMSFSGFWNR